jgi:hypothetical protein
MRLANQYLAIQISKVHSLMHTHSICSNLVPKLLLDILQIRYDQDQWSIFKGEVQLLTPSWISRRMLASVLIVIDLESWKSPSK